MKVTRLVRPVRAVVLVEDHHLTQLQRLVAVVTGLVAERIRPMDLPPPENGHGVKVPVQVPTTNWPLMITTQAKLLGVGLGEGPGDGVGEGVAVGVGDETGLGDEESEGLGKGLGDGEGCGSGMPASQVWNVTPSPVVGAPVCMFVTKTSLGFCQAFHVQAVTERLCEEAQGRKVGR